MSGLDKTHRERDLEVYDLDMNKSMNDKYTQIIIAETNPPADRRT